MSLVIKQARTRVYEAYGYDAPMPLPAKIARHGKLRLTLVCAVIAWCLAAPAWGQPSLDAASIEQAPVIDGEIGESEWSGASVIDQPFLQIEPEFGEASSFRTRVRVAQTATALYVAFEAFDPEPSRLAAAISRRDGGLHSDDSVTVALDPFGDGRTAYLFRTNALAARWTRAGTRHG